MNSIIALWSHPRSMSTAFERVMRERRDLTCFHEPFMYDYYVHRQVRVMPHFDMEPDHPRSYAEVRDMLLKCAEREPVFFKDMSYYVYPQITGDPDFYERLTDLFLIRNPMASIASYYKLDPELTLDEIGLEKQWRHFDWLSQKTGAAPVVVEAEAVQEDPMKTISHVWSAIGLPFVEDAFEWETGELPAGWEQVAGWHEGVSGSSGIQPVDRETADAKATARFETLAAEAPKLRDYLDHHRPYYQKLKEHALTA